LHELGPKLSNSTPPYYQFLLLKKIHKDAEKNALIEKDRLKEQHIPSEAIGNINDVASVKEPFLHKENNDDDDEVPTASSEHGNGNSEGNVVDHIASAARDETTEHNPSLQGGLLEGKEDISGKFAPKEGVSEKEKLHSDKSVGNENELNEKIEGTRIEPFMPNDVASKSFQENLEPVEGSNMKPIDISQGNIRNHHKNVLTIIPEELKVDEVEVNTEKDSIHASKQNDLKPSVENGHKLESTNSNSVPDNKLHSEETLPVNPGRLFNDSLFQQAGMENVDSDGKQKIEKPQEIEAASSSSSSNAEKNNHQSKLTNTKKPERARVAPIIDVLTFPEISSEKSLLNTDSGKTHIADQSDKSLKIEENKDKSRLEEKHEMTHNVEDKRLKFHVNSKEKHENLHPSHEASHVKPAEKISADNKQLKTDSLSNEKTERPNLPTNGKFKPLNNPLPSILFKEILHTDDTVTKITKKGKRDKKKTKTDEEKNIKKVTESEDRTKKKVTSPGLKNMAKSGAKLDLSDLESLQLQSKDDIELGTGDDEEGTGDDEYVDASGDDDDEESEIKDGPDQSNLSIANLAIWKASEDIHALLHSLTDREHADKVLGNLRNFIRNKHSVDAKKRDFFDSNIKKKKGNHLPDLASKALVRSVLSDLSDAKKSAVPPFQYAHIDLKKKSNIPNTGKKTKTKNC